MPQERAEKRIDQLPKFTEIADDAMFPFEQGGIAGYGEARLLKNYLGGWNVSFQTLTTTFSEPDDCFASAVVFGGKAIVMVNLCALYNSSSTIHDFTISGVIADRPNTDCGWVSASEGAVSAKLRQNGSNYSVIRIDGIDSPTGSATGTLFFIASVV